ncbi:hypothetical protein ACVC7O_07025 [Roseobacter sp. A03A-229]
MHASRNKALARLTRQRPPLGRPCACTTLDISPHTVDTLTRRVSDKLNVSDHASAAIRGLGSGVLKYTKGTVT